MGEEEYRAEYPDPEREDIQEALAFAAEAVREMPCPSPEADLCQKDQPNLHGALKDAATP